MLIQPLVLITFLFGLVSMLFIGISKSDTALVDLCIVSVRVWEVQPTGTRGLISSRVPRLHSLECL